MDKMKKSIKPILILLLWLAVFIALTPLASLLIENPLKPSNLGLHPTNNTVHYHIEEFSINQELLTMIYVTGWAFIENDTESPEKEVFLVFANDQNQYEIKMDLFNRGDLKIALPDLQVPSDRVGFRQSFSTLGMKNGIYRLYMVVNESPTLVGVIDTGMDYKVHFRGFERK